MTRPHIEAVDVARGCAALSVAVYHYGTGPALARVSGLNWLGAVSWPGSAIAVPLFFVVSGFCIHFGAIGRPAAAGFALSFYVQRFFRIYPAWLVAIACSVGLRWLWGEDDLAPGLWKYLTLTNGFGEDYRLNPVLWSVSVEFFLYLLYPPWLALRQRRGLGVAVATVAGASLLSAIATSRLVVHPGGMTLWFFLNVWIGWIAGCVLAELWAKRSGSVTAARWMAATGIGAIALHVVLERIQFYRGPWLFARLPVLILLCTWPLYWLLQAGTWMELRRPAVLHRIWRFAAVIGISGYSLYLLHMPLVKLRLLLEQQFPLGTGARVALFAGWFGLMLGVSVLSYRWIERPAWNLGRALARRVAPAPGDHTSLAGVKT